MKKGEKLLKVQIERGGKLTVTTTDGSIAKLSRSERNALANYKNKSYIEDVRKMFGNRDIFADDFTIEKNVEIKFTYTK